LGAGWCAHGECSFRSVLTQPGVVGLPRSADLRALPPETLNTLMWPFAGLWEDPIDVREIAPYNLRLAGRYVHRAVEGALRATLAAVLAA
jgi:hypothetical protein